MSDYCTSCGYDPKARHGEGSCPFNSLYWGFYARNRDKFESNPRVGMIYRTWDHMAAAERKRTLRQAEIYRRDLNRL